MREIQAEQVRHKIDGRPAVSLVPVIPADAAPALREGLRRRRVGAVLGRCPCGATRQMPVGEVVAWDVSPDTLTYAPFAHTDDCPAHADRLGPEIEAWQQKEGK